MLVNKPHHAMAGLKTFPNIFCIISIQNNGDRISRKQMLVFSVSILIGYIDVAYIVNLVYLSFDNI